MEKIITCMIGKNKIFFNLKSLYLLNDLLYDSQIVLTNLKNDTLDNNFVLEIHRADYNRKKVINLFIFKLCFVKEVISKLIFFDVISVEYIMNKQYDFNEEKFSTIYSITSDSNDFLIIETEKFNIKIKPIVNIELVDVKKLNSNYLRLINSTGLNFFKWNDELKKINNPDSADL
jgi:hypothetical protein